MGSCYGQRQNISVIPLSQSGSNEVTNDFEASGEGNHISIIRNYNRPILEHLIMKNNMKKKLNVN